MLDLSVIKNKRVLVTGHTGFKGSWLCYILKYLGAKVYGYALEPETEPSLFHLANIANGMNSIIGDIRDFDRLKQVFDISQPEFVFHLAAQPLVREGYSNPRYTYETNVMGIVNVLECIKEYQSVVKSFINITTDKVYASKEDDKGYNEEDILDGYDPYSNSKSCSELITNSYRRSFFYKEECPAISTVRAGNVIGGGDFSKDRIIPDCVRAAINQEDIVVRNPDSVRPYQHVLEPLFVYLMIAIKQYEDKKYSGYYNVGPENSNYINTGRLAELFCNYWGNDLKWICKNDMGPHEVNLLKLDCSKLKNVFEWKAYWDIETSIEKTVEWTKCFVDRGNIFECMNNQIEEYISRN